MGPLNFTPFAFVELSSTKIKTAEQANPSAHWQYQGPSTHKKIFFPPKRVTFRIEFPSTSDNEKGPTAKCVILLVGAPL